MRKGVSLSTEFVEPEEEKPHTRHMPPVTADAQHMLTTQQPTVATPSSRSRKVSHHTTDAEHMLTMSSVDPALLAVTATSPRRRPVALLVSMGRTQVEHMSDICQPVKTSPRRTSGPAVSQVFHVLPICFANAPQRMLGPRRGLPGVSARGKLEYCICLPYARSLGAWWFGGGFAARLMLSTCFLFSGG